MHKAQASDRKIRTKSKDAAVKCYVRDPGYSSDIECKIFATNKINQPLKFGYNKTFLTVNGRHEDSFEMTLMPQDLKSKYKFLFDKPGKLKLYPGIEFKKVKIKIFEDEKINLYELNSQNIYSTPVNDLEFALAVEVDDLDIKTDQIKDKIKRRIKGARERKRLNPVAEKLYYNKKNNKYYYLFRFQLTLRKSSGKNRTTAKLSYAPLRSQQLEALPKNQKIKRKYYYKLEVFGVAKNEHSIDKIFDQPIGKHIEIDEQTYGLMIKNEDDLSKKIYLSKRYKIKKSFSMDDHIGTTVEFELTPLSRLGEIPLAKEEPVKLRNKLRFEFDLPECESV